MRSQPKTRGKDKVNAQNKGPSLFLTYEQKADKKKVIQVKISFKDQQEDRHFTLKGSRDRQPPHLAHRSLTPLR